MFIVHTANSQKPLANSPRARKAQVSLEYMMVAGVVLITIIPAVYMFLEYSRSSNQQIRESQIMQLGTDIVTTAEMVYFQGKPSRVTVEGTLPENVVGVDVVGDWENKVNRLVFYFSKSGGISELTFSSKVDISGYVEESESSSGIKSVLVSAQEDGNGVPYVYVSFKKCGDGVCAADESCQVCFEDCGACA